MSCGCRREQELAGLVSQERRGAGGHQAVVTDADKVLGQDVEQEAADEFSRGDGDPAAVLGQEGDDAVGDLEQALVGDAGAVRVAAEVLDGVFGSTEGRFDVGVPVDAVEVI